MKVTLEGTPEEIKEVLSGEKESTSERLGSNFIRHHVFVTHANPYVNQYQQYRPLSGASITFR